MQGFNMGRYYPPSPPTSSKHHNHHNNSSSKHTSSKPPTIRFEMPFAVWCTTCAPEALIGQGVRFNATKRRVGSYLSTPVWAFGMRHAPCGGEIEVTTDPANTEYRVTRGGRRRDYGSPDHHSPTPDPSARPSAIARLERTIAHRAALATSSDRIRALTAAQASWHDPYTLNQRLRAARRPARRALARQRQLDDDLSARYALHPRLRLLPPCEDDARRAAAVEFGRLGLLEAQEAASREHEFGASAKHEFGASAQQEFGASALHEAQSGRPALHESEDREVQGGFDAVDASTSLATAVVANTRRARDPFISHARAPFTRRPPPSKKRTQAVLSQPQPAPAAEAPQSHQPSAQLVQYDSD